MSTIVRNREPRSVPGEAEALAPRAVRLRNVCLRQIAARRGLRPLSAEDFARLDDRVGLAEAVRWWEPAQQAEEASGDRAAPSLDLGRSAGRVWTKAAFITALMVLALALLSSPAY